MRKPYQLPGVGLKTQHRTHDLSHSIASTLGREGVDRLHRDRLQAARTVSYSARRERLDALATFSSEIWRAGLKRRYASEFAVNIMVYYLNTSRWKLPLEEGTNTHASKQALAYNVDTYAL